MSTIEQAELLRSKHREKRAQIDVDAQNNHAQKLCDRLTAIPQIQEAQHIAAYIAIRGEISLEKTMQHLASVGKQLYLPVLRGEAMHFAPWSPGQPLLKKAFGLLEPAGPESTWRPAKQLDLVLAPLVVFDPGCNRIGQGGGYYDRTFAFKREEASKLPVLLGVAHESQLEAHLPVQAWDIPLDFVATDSQLYQQSN